MFLAHRLKIYVEGCTSASRLFSSEVEGIKKGNIYIFKKDDWLGRGKKKWDVASEDKGIADLYFFSFFVQ